MFKITLGLKTDNYHVSPKRIKGRVYLNGKLDDEIDFNDNDFKLRLEYIDIEVIIKEAK